MEKVCNKCKSKTESWIYDIDRKVYFCQKCAKNHLDNFPHPFRTFSICGVCHKCGDTNGPWEWDIEKKIWICEDCARNGKEK